MIATGSVYNYFGNDGWAQHAPGVRSIEHARATRARLLWGFVHVYLLIGFDRRLSVARSGSGAT